jgi:hypothetical protein
MSTTGAAPAPQAGRLCPKGVSPLLGRHPRRRGGGVLWRGGRRRACRCCLESRSGRGEGAYRQH